MENSLFQLKINLLFWRNSMRKQIEAVIFDLDGVITDTAEYHYLAWKTLAEELNIPFSRELNEELKGISRMDSLERILVHGKKNHDFTESEKASLADKKNNHYCTLIQRITPEDILPGIQALISEIKERGLKVGIASVSKNAFTVIDSLRLKEQFDAIVDAKTIKNSKPDPEIFLTAAKLLQVEATACIGIEDAAAGVEAIKEAGMFAIGIGSKQTLSKADIVFESTADLLMNAMIESYEKT